MTYEPGKFKVAMCNGLEDAFTRKNIIWIWPWGKGHIKYCPVPTVWSCYVQRFRRICIYKNLTLGSWSQKMLPSTPGQYPLHHVTNSPAKFEVATSSSLGGDAFTTIGIIWPLTLRSTLYIMWPMHLQSLKLLYVRNLKMYLQENALFDLWHWLKVTQNVAQYPLHYVTYAPAQFENVTCEGFGEDAFTRNMTESSMHGWTDRRWTNFGTKLYPFFLKKKRV